MIEKLELNKSVYFYTDYNKTDELVRTGVPSEFSLLHSILFLTTANYSSLSDEYKQKLAEDLNNLIQPPRSKEDKMALKIKFLNKLKSAYEDTSSSVDPDDLQACIVFFHHMISLSDFKTSILPSVMSSEMDFKQALLSETELFHRKKFDQLTALEKRSVGHEKIERCVSKLLKIIEGLFDEIAPKTLNNPLTPATPSKGVIKRLCDSIDRNIYFISPERTVYTIDPPKKRRSIIIVNIGGEQYEPVSKLLPTKKIQRDFDVNEGIIARFTPSSHS